MSVAKVNILGVELDESLDEAGFRHPAASVGARLVARRIGASVYRAEPYHHVHGRETWLPVLAGAPTLRHPQGEQRLDAGDLLCLPEGPAGAHRLLNRGNALVRALLLSTAGVPAAVCYPDSGLWLIRNRSDDIVLREPERR